LKLWHLFIENLPLNNKQSHETCQEVIVTNVDECHSQVRCNAVPKGVAKDRTVGEKD